MDELKYRKARLRRRTTDGSYEDLGADITINMIQALPILSMTDLTESSISVDVTTAAMPDGNRKPTNEYYDPDYDNRFKFIISGRSIYRNVPYCIYYDMKYTDFIILPNPDTLDPDLIKNKTFTIEGYQYGVEKPIANTIVDSEIVKKSFPEGKEPNSVVVELLEVYGIINSVNSRIRYNINNTDSLYKDINPFQAIKVRKSEIMDDGNIPIHSLTYRTFNYTDFIYSYNKDPDYIWLPIPF